MVRRVLLIEDDAVDAAAAARALRYTHEHHEVQIVATLGRALEVLESSQPDAIVADLRLPDAQGVAVVTAVRNAAPSVPVVVLTGNAGSELGISAIAAGAEEFISKEALSRELLPRTIGFAIERQRARQLERRLESSVRFATLGRLAAGVAHEINNPAAYVMGNLEILRLLLERLQRHGAPAEIADQAHDLLDGSLEGIQRIASIVGELKSFSARRADPVEWVDLTVVARSACAMLRGPLRQKAELELDLDEVPKFPGYSGKLVQVLTNLIVNAIEACDGDNHTIRVSTHKELGAVAVSVEDDGRGIPPALVDRIFEPFFTARAGDGGTGLGLAISQQIVAQHRGELSVSSRVGPGTRFLVRIPLNTGMKVLEPVPDSPPELESDRLRILIAEDEEQLRAAYGLMFESRHDVVLATNGATALAEIERNAQFDVILCDMSMPTLGGPGVLREVRRRFPELADRIVFCTGGALDEAARAVLESRETVVLEKPVSMSEIVETVERVGRRPRSATTHAAPLRLLTSPQDKMG